MSLAANPPDVARTAVQTRAAGDARTDAILDRITATFAKKGFEGSSMQELAAAAGMSVGNFYRYYPSKLALIAALVERCAADVRTQFDAMRRAPEPFEAMRTMLYDELMRSGDTETTFWLQVDAAAAMHPEIAAVKRAMNEAVRANIRDMLGRACVGPRCTPERLDDMADFMFVFCSSLFRERAFEPGDDPSGRLKRMVSHLFDILKRELADAGDGAFRNPEGVSA